MQQQYSSFSKHAAQPAASTEPVAEVWSVQPGDEDSFGVVRFLTGDPDNMWSFPRQGDKLFLTPQPAEPTSELMRLMPEVLASLKGSGVDVSLAADVERALRTAPKFGEEK